MARVASFSHILTLRVGSPLSDDSVTGSEKAKRRLTSWGRGGGMGYTV